MQPVLANLTHTAEAGAKPLLELGSRLGLGCAQVGNLYRSIDEADARAVFDAARLSGFTVYDTAPGYGNGLSEMRTGAFLRDHPGCELKLSTKVGRYFIPGPHQQEREFFAAPLPFTARFDYGYDGVMRSFEQSLLRLGLTAVDRLFVHDLDSANHGDALGMHYQALIDGGLRALDELRSTGATRQIGIAVNQPELGIRLLQDGVFDVALLASCYTLIQQSALDGFLPLAQAQGIEIVIGGVFNSGVLATGAAPNARYDYVEAGAEVLARVAAIEAVCHRYSVPLAAAALRFALAHPLVTTVLIGTSSPRRIDDNRAALAHPIPADLWADLQSADLLRADAPVPLD